MANEGAAARRFARDVVLAGVADALKSGRTFIIVPILARLLGPEDYGVWGQVKVTSAFLAPFLVLGLNTAVVRFVAGDRDGREARAAFSAALCVSLAVGLAVGILLLSFEGLAARTIFGGPGQVGFVWLAALFVGLEALDQLALSHFQALRRTAAHAGLVLVETAVEVSIVAFLFAGGASLESVVVALVAWKAGIVGLRLLRIAWSSGLAWPRWASLAPWLRYGLPIGLSSVFFLVTNYGDRYFINWWLGTREVGMYGVAYTLGSLPLVLVAPLDYVVYASVAEAWRGDRVDEVRARVTAGIRCALLITIPVVFALTALAGPMMRLFATAEFATAAGCVGWIALGFLFLGVGVFGERVVLVSGRSRTVTVIYAGLAALNVALNVILVPRLGITGAGIATAVTFAAYAMAFLGLCHRISGVDLPSHALWKPVAAASLMTALLYHFGVPSLAGGALSVVGGGVLYVAAIMALGGVGRREWGALR